MDEATSALDTQSEKLVQMGLDAAQVGRTCVCIAHRLSTIENASNITVLKNGKLVEEGTHETLMKNGHVYFELQARNMISCKIGSVQDRIINRRTSLELFLIKSRKCVDIKN